MEQANKEIGSRLVVSAEAAQAAGIRDPVPFSELPVRGRSLPVRLCRLAILNKKEAVGDRHEVSLTER